jgi:hypothetical protein
MKLHRKLIGSFIAACVLTAAAFAAEASPTGLWKWTVQGRQGGQGFEQSLKLELKDGILTGLMLGRQAGNFSVPDSRISDASFKDGKIAFSIKREFNGQSFVIKYEGKLDGDTIQGTFERGALGKAGPTKSEWNAKRQK